MHEGDMTREMKTLRMEMDQVKRKVGMYDREKYTHHGHAQMQHVDHRSKTHRSTQDPYGHAQMRRVGPRSETHHFTQDTYGHEKPRETADCRRSSADADVGYDPEDLPQPHDLKMTEYIVHDCKSMTIQQLLDEQKASETLLLHGGGPQFGKMWGFKQMLNIDDGTTTNAADGSIGGEMIIPPKFMALMSSTNEEMTVFVPTTQAITTWLNEIVPGMHPSLAMLNGSRELPKMLRKSIAGYKKTFTRVLKSKGYHKINRNKAWDAFFGMMRSTALNHIVPSIRINKATNGITDGAVALTANGHRAVQVKAFLSSVGDVIKTMVGTQTGSDFFENPASLFRTVANALPDYIPNTSEAGPGTIRVYHEANETFPLKAKSHGMASDNGVVNPLKNLDVKHHNETINDHGGRPATVLATFECSNGVVHVVDKVLTPLLIEIGMYLPV
jgi:hypothetical protein